MDANFGELVFRAESAREAEARVTRHAREIAAQLSEAALPQVSALAACSDIPADSKEVQSVCHIPTSCVSYRDGCAALWEQRCSAISCHLPGLGSVQ